LQARRHPGVGWLKGLLDARAVDLRARLEPDERVIAIGRAEDITLRGDIDAGGAGWTFVMVTDRHLRWVPRCRLHYATTVPFDDVTTVLERTSAHRYAISLRHGSIQALRSVPAHRFLHFQWGDTDAVRTLRITTLAFSRRDTRAARALREQLALRGVVPRIVRSPPRKPREPPQYLILRHMEDQ
jgi:hypothetical protein